MNRALIQPQHPSTIHRCRASLAVVCCLITPVVGQGQQPNNSLSGTALAIWGGLSGAGLATAYINPPGQGWLVSDETALALGVTVGLGTALLVHSAASHVDVSSTRRPRLRVTAGLGGRFGLDYALAYRTPLGNRSELETAILVVNDSWEQKETQTRCSALFGCITGTFITAHSYQQIVTLVVRGVRHLASNSFWDPTLAVGGGPGIVHVLSDVGTFRHTVLPLDVGVGIEGGGRYRWTATTGIRVTVGSVDTASIDDPTWYVRAGVALGG